MSIEVNTILLRWLLRLLLYLMFAWHPILLSKSETLLLAGNKNSKNLSVTSLKVHDIFVAKSQSMEICYCFSYKSTNFCRMCLFVF